MPELRQTIEDFLRASLQPALSEPGEETLALSADNFAIETRGASLSLQAWDGRRNLVRRITGIERQTSGKLVLKIERFPKRPGTLALVDLARPSGVDVEIRTRRLEFRERFRLFLRRQFPGFDVAGLTTEPDLEHSLSPTYPRALLRRRASAWAAIGASPDRFHAEGVLTFGLIWLDYLRRREPGLAIQGLILYLPAGLEKTTCLRLLFMDPLAAQYTAFVYGDEGEESRVDLADYGNLDTRLEPCAGSLQPWLNGILDSISETPGVETIGRSDGERSLRVHGMEFARTSKGELLFGLDRKRVARPSNAGEVRGLAASLSRLRSAGAADRQNRLYMRNPEAWLESQVRNAIEQMDARFLAAPVYGQVPAFAAADRGVLDLLAVERGGRLAVLELKASEDPHLPLQALDYWMRVKWHLDRDEFSAKGYFPGIELRNQAPRLLLVSPALDFHPSNETVLRYFSSAVPVERVGVGLEWRKELKVMSRS
jgi:hypothetical protein